MHFFLLPPGNSNKLRWHRSKTKILTQRCKKHLGRCLFTSVATHPGEPTSILAAVLLQLLLQVTLALEHKVAGFFSTKPGPAMKAMRMFVAWLILFGSKFVMLGAINFAFGDDVLFTGPLHGVVAFIAVVVVMLVAEELITRLYRRLAPPAVAT